jgi:hypothetical protein
MDRVSIHLFSRDIERRGFVEVIFRRLPKAIVSPSATLKPWTVSCLSSNPLISSQAGIIQRDLIAAQQWLSTSDGPNRQSPLWDELMEFAKRRSSDGIRPIA